MTKQEFNTEIAEEIRRQIADKTEIMLHSVSKNNGLVLDALTIMYPGTCAAPTMYLEPYYRDFLQGESIENLADRLLSLAIKEATPPDLARLPQDADQSPRKAETPDPHLLHTPMRSRGKAM